MSYLQRAREFEEAGDLTAARDAYRRAIDTGEGEGEGGAKLLLLEVLDQLHDNDAVLALCDDLDGKGFVPVNGRVVVVKSAAIPIARAAAFLRSEWWDQAEAEARRAIAELDESGGVVAGPGHRLGPFDAWFVLAQALRFGGDPAAAIEPYRRAIALMPGHPQPHVELAIALNATGDVAGAEQEVLRATELGEDNDAFYNLACYRAMLGKCAEAIAALRRAIQLEPGNKQLAQTDADFANIRQDPEFAALVDV